MKKVIFIFLGILFFLFFLGLLKSWDVNHKPAQKIFLGGKVPKNMPNGFYKGSVGNVKTPWLGKTFDRATSTGRNVFMQDKQRKQLFPFKTYRGKGLVDKDLDVIKIDYTQTDTWWLRYVLDEIVEVAPGKFLGKAHIILIPGLPLTVGYFELEK